jgi:Tfp pilus assembly PilM family ATPase
MSLYASQNGRQVRRSILIGGGANLKHLPALWEQNIGHKAFVGNPWRGLAYPQALENRLSSLGPTYAVAVGLAERGARGVQ